METSVKTFKEPPNLHEEEGDGVEEEISPRVKYKVLLDNITAEVDNMSAKVTIAKLVVSLTFRQYIPVRDDARIKVMGDRDYA